jgi:pyridoxal phosphate enzyme (YggS family)
MTEVEERLKAVRSAIAEVAANCGRDPAHIELVAVSKGHSPESVRTALDAGQEVFGESRVQEARAKIPLVASRARWHFIGHLQKNKVRHALPLFELFHGIDSLALARDMNRVAAEAGLYPRGLVEVNISGESSKYGFSPEALDREIDELLALDRLQIEGLMTIAPLAKDAEASRQFFAALRELRDQLAKRCGVPLPHLSMGMSNDFAVAIEEGATLLRIGTAVFGPRPPARRATDEL